MKHVLKSTIALALGLAFVGEAAATEWNVSVWGKRRAFTEHIEKLAELVEAKTDGEFTMNVSYGGLSKNRENLDGISIGAFEMAQFCAGYHADKNRVVTVLELPFLGVETLAQERAVSKAVYSHPAAAAEMEQWNAKLLMTSPMPQYKAFEAVGAVPTSVTATEAYQAMESGVVDTVAFAQHAHLSFGTINQAEWWTANLNPGTVNCPVVVNVDAYDSLSDKEREALDSSIEESLDHYLSNYADLLTRWDSVLEEKGVKKVEIAPEVIEEFRAAAAAPARDAWIADMESQGLPGQELYDLVVETLAEAKAAGQ